MRQRQAPRGTYSRGVGGRRRATDVREVWDVPVGPRRPRPPEGVKPPGAVGVESWGVLPAKPPGRGR